MPNTQPITVVVSAAFNAKPVQPVWENPEWVWEHNQPERLPLMAA
jgi:hypothetical protein